MGTWTTRLRTGTGVAVIAALAATATVPATAGQPSKEENVGVATGLAVGALAGGPVGAVVGAAAGAWFGDRWHRETSTRRQVTADNAALSSSLRDARAQSATLVQRLDRLHELETEIAFRTEDASVSSEAAGQLQRLGMLLADLPGTRVRVSGYADARGTESFNLQLSARRAAAVAAELAKAGIPAERLLVEAHGENASVGAETDTDALALERRVTVRVERDDIAVAQGSAIR